MGMEEQTKMPTGIEGLDEITRGGLPRDRTTLLVGGPGSGKTVLGLQTLVNGARRWGEPGIFVACEERAERIVANAASFGWDLPALQADRLFFLDARPAAEVITAGKFDLQGLLAGIEAKAAEMGARRIVFDSLDVLLSLLEDPAAERHEVYRIHDWLAGSGMSGLVSARLDGAYPLLSQRYGFMQFMADCVLLLDHRLHERVSLRTLRVVKYRGSGFAERETALLIGPQGIEVADPGTQEPAYPVYSERVSTGIAALDGMLRGGYHRGSSVLVSGAPGAAKTTLGGAFVEAACRRGERALLVTFDESTAEVVRNLASVGIHLEPHLGDLLHVHALRTRAGSAEEHLMQLRHWLEQYEPQCAVVDPLSALLKAGGSVSALGVAERLIHLAKSRDCTLLCTSLLEGQADTEGTPMQVSTIADVWIHLSFLERGGERNRALSVIKARGTGHSNQVRELLLSDEGLGLAEVYSAGGEVLMGTLRLEREATIGAERARVRAELARKRAELELAQVEAQARLEALRAELEILEMDRQRRDQADRLRVQGQVPRAQHDAEEV